MQENGLASCRLFFTDKGCKWWWWHTLTSEDEHCRHVGWEVGTRHKQMHFFKDGHGRSISRIKGQCNLDVYAWIVSDYTSREMSVLSDADRAMKGMLDSIGGTFKGDFIQCLPDTEMEAALLWCPTGFSQRRVEETTGQFLFPSWSWVGWVGIAVYPWIIDRAFPMSLTGSPIFWLDAGSEEPFLGDKYRNNGKSTAEIPDDEEPWCYTSTYADRTKRLYLHPVNWATFGRPYKFLEHPKSHRLHFAPGPPD
jgi:hypothetical protein